MTASRNELCGYTALNEPELLFAGKKTDKHPLRGLIDNGPYSLKFGAPTNVRFRADRAKASNQQAGCAR
jgi:hypothetical protein